MYITTGWRYEYTKYCDVPELCKLIRFDIQHKHPGIKANVIPIYRKDELYTIEVHIVKSIWNLKNPHYDENFMWDIKKGIITDWLDEDEVKRMYLNPIGDDVRKNIERILDSYNKTESDENYYKARFGTRIYIDC